MHIISRDSPCYYLTSVTKNRLLVFRTDEIKLITCAALNEAPNSGKFALYAYVVMPDHLHVITDSALSPSRTLQFVNGITGRRLIDHLKKHNYEASLNKVRHEIRPRHYGYSLWDHHPHARLLLTENMLMQRVRYTHQNPVRAGLVKRPEDYRWSSIRCWSRSILDDEPLLMDIDRIKWRRSGGIAS
jgi:REP element-mobilizing transposase RayT